METAYKELYESRDALENILVEARKKFVKSLEQCKMGYDVVKVINYVFAYPDNASAELRKDIQKDAAVIGTAFMQAYAEYHTVCKIISLHEMDVANNQKQETQGETDGSTN